MTMEKTVEAARGRWKGILTMLGIDPKFLEDRHQQCPLCGGKDRFRWDNKEGSGSYFCSGCGPGSGIALLMSARSWGFARAAREIDGVLGIVKFDIAKMDRSEKDKRGAIRRLLKSSTPVTPGCPSWLYLERRCGDPSKVIRDLRHHRAIKHSMEMPGAYPALLAILRYADNRGASLHRTYLTPDGGKAAVEPVRKLMPGLPLEGSAVRLGEVQERLGIAEGIETAICAGKLHGLPVWSAISANGILAWQPPEMVRSVVIFGDNDENFVGQTAAYEKARMLRVKGLDVEIQIPRETGMDWCDSWSQLQKAMVV